MMVLIVMVEEKVSDIGHLLAAWLSNGFMGPAKKLLKPLETMPMHP